MPTTNVLPSNIDKGLFRTILAGKGGTLTNAFSKLLCSELAINKIKIPEKKVFSAQLMVPNEEGKGHWELLNINDDIYAVISRCKFNDVRKETVPPEGFIEIHICFTGPVQLDLSEGEEFSSSSPFTFLCMQGSNADYLVRFEAGQKNLISLYFKPSLLLTFGIDEAHTPLVLNKLLNGRKDSITYLQLPISIGVMDVATQILHNSYSGHTHTIYTEAKIWELLSIFFEDIIKSNKTNMDDISEIIPSHEMMVVEKARTILETNLKSTPTISELAKILGTNTTKLKQGFKIAFRMTIFECSHNYKMKEALRLLAKEKLPVGHVANAVGYQHQASFAAAFKSYYDISPKEAKKLSP